MWKYFILSHLIFSWTWECETTGSLSNKRFKKCLTQKSSKYNDQWYFFEKSKDQNKGNI